MEKLEKSLLLDTIPMGICVIDDTTRIISWNELLVKWTGIPQSEIYGKILTQVFPNLESELFHKRLANLFHDHNPLVYSASVHKYFIPIPQINGDSSSYMLQHTVIRFLSSDPARAIIYIEDVSSTYHQLNQLKSEVRDRKSTEKKLQQRNEILHRITHLQTKIVKHVNNAYIYDELLIDLMEIIKSKAGIVIKAKLNQVQKDNSYNSLNQEESFQTDIENYQFSIRAFKDLSTDVPDETSQMVHHFKEHREQISELIRKNFFSYVIKQGMIKQENYADCGNLDYKFEKYLALPVTNFNELLAIIVISLNEVSIEQSTIDLLSPILTTMGQLLRARRAETQKAHAMLELKLNAQRLEQAKKEADLATRSKSEFLANMSHEIRTPMTAILGFTEVLMENDLSFDETKSMIQVIHKNGEHLLSLINDILDISKIEAGKMTMEAIQFSPVEEAKHVLGMMKSRADLKKLELELEIMNPIPTRIISDPTRFRQVLVNLVGNAIKFTQQGFIRLVMSVKYPADLYQFPLLKVSVQDTGIGIENNKLPSIFESFSQADSSTTRQYGGTGLGLSISRKICQLLGGDLSVNSEIGTGSTFTATFQLDADAMKEVLNKESPRIDSGKELKAISIKSLKKNLREEMRSFELQVLVVDDAIDNRRLIDFILKKVNIYAHFAENGQNAIDMVHSAKDQGRPYHIILMDMHMPVMDGLTATEILKSEGYAGKIIALTANAMPQDRQKCLAAGCDEFLTKPINRKQLEQILMQMQQKLNSEAESQNLNIVQITTH